MTTLTIPDTELLRHLHSIARKNGLTVEFVHMGEPQPRRAPYRWRLAIAKEGAPADLVFGMAVRHASELPETVREAWSTFVGWGIA